MYGLIWLTDLRSKMDAIDLLIMLTSAVCHDLDHTGYNNAYQVTGPETLQIQLTSLFDRLCSADNYFFQINARTELALRYNDISPLENHHCAVAFEILEQVRRKTDLIGCKTKSSDLCFCRRRATSSEI